jgi:DNA-binding PadR family transcriptional regulator
MYDGGGHVHRNCASGSNVLKHALLGLLAERPRHGYDLKAAFEGFMGGTWPLNIGQVYTTLARLERDGLVDSEVVEQDSRPDRRVYRLTERGGKELDRWRGEAVALAPPLREQLYVKLLLHVLAPGGDVGDFVARTRRDVQAALAAVERRLTASPATDVTGLLLDAVSLNLQATLRWLDRVEARLLA